MNTENSKANELHKFRLILADKLNLKDPNKNMALFMTYGKKLSLYITTINLKSLLQLGTMNLICLIILSTPLKNLKL